MRQATGAGNGVASIRNVYSPRPEARIASVLLFAFPLFGASLQHWLSGVYLLLGLTALVALRRGIGTRTREDKLFVGVVLAYFGATVLANTLSGWTPASLRWFEADGRFLLAVPMYLFLRQHPELGMWLVRGIPLAGVIIGLDALRLTLFVHGYAWGVYGPIFLGDVATLLCLLSLASVGMATFRHPLRLPVHLLGAVMALVAVVLSGSRNAWLAVALGLPLVLLLLLRGMDRKTAGRLVLGVALAAAVITVAAIAALPHVTAERFQRAWAETADYVWTDSAERDENIVDTSIGIRLEQWRAAYLAFLERPLTGYGVGNLGMEINRLVEAGRISPAIHVPQADEGRGVHVHSAYFGALGNKGIIGFLALLVMLAYPVVVALRRDPRCGAAMLVIVHSAGFVVFGLTEEPFIRNNFSSIYLAPLVAFMAMLSRAPAEPGHALQGPRT